MQPMDIQHIMSKYDACWQTQRPTLGWPCNKQTPPHSSLTFSIYLEHPKSLSISTSPHKSEILTSLCSLRKELEALLSPLSHTHRSNTKREKNSQLSSPSHTYRSSSNKSFFQIFSSSCSQLEARVILALITPRIHV